MELRQFLQLLRRKMWLISFIVILVTASAGIYTVFFVSPTYEATNKLVVNKSDVDRSGNSLLDVNSINTNIMLINTYKEIISSGAILDKVVERYPDMNISAEELFYRIKVLTTQNSQIITLKVTDGSYQKAATLVNAISEVFKEEVPKIMMVDNITVLDSAKLNDHAVKVGPALKLNLVMAFVLSFMLSAGGVLLLDFLDDSVKTEVEVKQLFGLETIGVISRIRKKDLKKKCNKTSKKQAGENYVTISQ